MSWADANFGFRHAASLPGIAGHPLVRVLVIGAIGTNLYAALVRWLAPDIWGELRDRAIGAVRR